MVSPSLLQLDSSICLSSECKVKIAAYLEWEPRTEARHECLELIKHPEENKNEIELRFLKRLEFGTAGLRGLMGAGFNRMNDVTVIEASQGLCKYWIRKFGIQECSKRGVVIGFDGRHNSQRYANAAAAVFLSQEFKVYLNSKVTATPMNSFTVIKCKCVGGVQVTASHNPAVFNGYKVYADNGVQIISPMDEDVSALINENLKPWDAAIALLEAGTGMLKDLKSVIDPYDMMFKSYMDEITDDLCTRKAQTATSDLKIIYTAMHGVGYPFVAEILKRFGYERNLHVVEEQKLPDPEFSTVMFPNPEEEGALDLGIALADKIGSPMVIANDPDADRFASAEKQKDGKWKIFQGDELGILLGAEAYEANLAKGIPKEKMLFICSAVSSRMLQKMVETEGCRFEETMTGFKWMMNKAMDLHHREGFVPCFVYEEALGYALDIRVADKDGVSAAAVWVQMATELYKKRMTVSERLDQLRKKYGYFVTNNSYYFCYDKNAISELFAEFRNNGKYKPALGNYKIKRIRDVTNGYDDGQPGNKCTFPLAPSSQMITLFFQNGAVLTLRTSGTEPKLKWYSELSGSNPDEARAELQKVVDATIEYFMQPHKYPLQMPNSVQ